MTENFKNCVETMMLTKFINNYKIFRLRKSSILKNLNKVSFTLKFQFISSASFLCR